MAAVVHTIHIWRVAAAAAAATVWQRVFQICRGNEAGANDSIRRSDGALMLMVERCLGRFGCADGDGDGNADDDDGGIMISTPPTMVANIFVCVFYVLGTILFVVCDILCEAHKGNVFSAFFCVYFDGVSTNMSMCDSGNFPTVSISSREFPQAPSVFKKMYICSRFVDLWSSEADHSSIVS